MNFLKTVILALFATVTFSVFAQVEQKAPEATQSSFVSPQNIDGWWVNKTMNSTQKFAFEKIKISGNQVTGEFTIWSSGSSNCGVYKASIVGIVEGETVKFPVPAKCSQNYVATFNFKEKTGSYKTDTSIGIYNYSY